MVTLCVVILQVNDMLDGAVWLHYVSTLQVNDMLDGAVWLHYVCYVAGE